MHAPIHKIVITGTGRAGTTFLVRLLTELGMETGYTPANWRRDYFEHCQAGLEHNIEDPNAPYIVKNPSLCGTLDQFIASGRFVIDHALIPIRDLDATTASRVRIGGKEGSIQGGIIGTGDPSAQKCVLAEMLHHLVLTLTIYEVPHTFLVFPRFVKDSGYAFEKLSGILNGIDRATFDKAFQRVADPSLVHEFKGVAQPAACDLSELLTANQRKRTRRRFRRIATWSVIAASLAINIGVLWPKKAPERIAAEARLELKNPSALLALPSHLDTKSQLGGLVSRNFEKRFIVSNLWMQAEHSDPLTLQPPLSVKKPVAPPPLALLPAAPAEGDIHKLQIPFLTTSE